MREPVAVEAAEPFATGATRGRYQFGPPKIRMRERLLSA